MIGPKEKNTVSPRVSSSLVLDGNPASPSFWRSRDTFSWLPMPREGFLSSLNTGLGCSSAFSSSLPPKSAPSFSPPCKARFLRFNSFENDVERSSVPGSRRSCSSFSVAVRREDRGSRTFCRETSFVFVRTRPLHLSLGLRGRRWAPSSAVHARVRATRVIYICRCACSARSPAKLCEEMPSCACLWGICANERKILVTKKGEKDLQTLISSRFFFFSCFLLFNDNIIIRYFIKYLGIKAGIKGY